MSSSHPHIGPSPIMLVAAGCLVVLALLAALLHGNRPSAPSLVAVTGSDRDPSASVVQQTLALRFVDREDGAVVVLTGNGERVVSVLPAGGSGFVRGVLRSLARERRLQARPAGTPLTLGRARSGELMLIDPTTRQTVVLDAFGQTNASEFARLLERAGELAGIPTDGERQGARAEGGRNNRGST